ncbi:S-layer homology domain-containing protein [Sporosarcina jeotgali]|uniref:S-layer homology domain-containing protein n=1 Tax=Sporosarcina jeotgali TaxID=3020056 RepID=A0ABZ0KYP6_9BACL|nr:S-layer homology domain-containing protein [Sporosarcina sp. B2O-1]WOV84718.1 S-layer homology domain-containing protein [Sporosarcina sp. B2O-1]
MAQQSKSYKKFVATAATATLVASAIVPVASANVTTSAFTDVPASYNEAVEFVVANNIAQGLTATQFGINSQIKRGDVAIMIAAAANLNDEKAPAAGFSDVPKRGALAINSLKAAGVISGKTTTKFGFEDNVTRGEAALMLQKAFKLEAGTTKNDFSDVSDRYDAAVDALVANKVTSGINAKQFGTQNNIKRGDFAKFLFALKELIEVPDVAADVTSVDATNQKTLMLKGAGLTGLKAADITVEGNGVASVTPVADGKSATVTLTGELAPNKATTVKVKLGEETKEFKVTYTFGPKAASVKSEVYDDDTANQRLTLMIDGVATDIDYLNTAGYEVKFTAYDKDMKPTTELFDGSTSSTTGKLKTIKKIGDYYVQAVVSKDSTILTSEMTKIEVRNLDNAATTSTELTLVNNANKDMEIDKTLVVGETAVIDSFYVGNGQTIVGVKNLKDVKVTSSNEAVLSVKDNEVTAVGLGTATITYKYGNATVTRDITVAGAKRVPTAVAAGAGVVKPIVGGFSTFKVAVTDQYGDDFLPTAGTVKVSFPQGVDFKTAPTTTFGTGVIQHTFDVAKGGQTGSVIYKDANDNVIGTLTLQTTEVNNKVSTMIKGGTFNGDNIINTFDERDTVANYTLKQYTSEGLFNGDISTADVAGYKVKFDSKIVTVNGNTNGEATLTNAKLEVKPANNKVSGTTNVVVYDKDGKLVDQVSVTVTSGAASIQTVNWKTAPTVNYIKQVNYKDVLDITPAAAGSDDVVNGIALNISPVNKVRIDNTGRLYLDKNDNGSYNPGTGVDSDEYLGTLYAYVTTNTKDMSNVGISNAVNGYVGLPVKAGSKGIITFAVRNDNNQAVLATKDVAVDVLPNAGTTPPVTPPVGNETIAITSATGIAQNQLGLEFLGAAEYNIAGTVANSTASEVVLTFTGADPTETVKTAVVDGKYNFKIAATELFGNFNKVTATITDKDGKAQTATSTITMTIN